MSLYEDWMGKAFNQNGRSVDAVWDSYLPKEQKIYEYILEEKVEKIEGTVQELADRFSMTPEEVVAFVDGLNETLDPPYEVKELEEESPLTIVIDFTKLYKKMVEYKAEHLYSLPQWDNIFDEDQRKELFRAQRTSRTVVKTKAEKIGRNDPCPCGSGKKYKKCCGA